MLPAVMILQKRVNKAVTFSEITARLKEAGIESAAFEAAELIAHFEKVSRASARFGDFSSTELSEAVERRISGTALQYIIGEWDFMGYTFKVSCDCLIPRADTELLCSFLCENAPKNGYFADLCTGSGCIAVAALCERPDLRAVAVELYPETLEIAKENARRLGVADRIEFIQGDVTEDVLCEKFDIIVSNPPYIALSEMDTLEKEVLGEPRHALTDGGDGLSVIRKIIEIYPAHLKDNAPLAVEIGWKQGAAVTDIAESFGLQAEILKDIESRDRVVVIKRKETV